MDNIKVEITREEAFALIRFVGDVLQAKDDTELMNKLLWNSTLDDVEAVRRVRDKVGDIVNAHIQAVLASM